MREKGQRRAGLPAAVQAKRATGDRNTTNMPHPPTDVQRKRGLLYLLTYAIGRPYARRWIPTLTRLLGKEVRHA